MVLKTFDYNLRKFIRRSPFRPFTVELVSGERIVIHHPEALAFQAGVAVYLSAKGAASIFDHESVSRITVEIRGTTSK